MVHRIFQCKLNGKEIRLNRKTKITSHFPNSKVTIVCLLKHFYTYQLGKVSNWILTFWIYVCIYSAWFAISICYFLGFDLNPLNMNHAQGNAKKIAVFRLFILTISFRFRFLLHSLHFHKGTTLSTFHYRIQFSDNVRHIFLLFFFFLIHISKTIIQMKSMKYACIQPNHTDSKPLPASWNKAFFVKQY